eukprot:TRINITY_DN90345_c0_g1_i1.p1 TRINITY_DN90345_c0_g1~~TRINITY_DN90345_c0_g1_i1.p1  ORF type:complete len:231 (-),score=42.71 TRINITY_DN90345_c0_g1_i1:180-782(-)
MDFPRRRRYRLLVLLGALVLSVSLRWTCLFAVTPRSAESPQSASQLSRGADVEELPRYGPAEAGTDSDASGGELRRDLLKSAAAGALALAAAFTFSEPARANLSKREVAARDAGGEDLVRVDINNADASAFIIFPGMYPTVAALITNNRPYKEVADLYKIPGISAGASAIIRKYEAKLECKAYVMLEAPGASKVAMYRDG